MSGGRREAGGGEKYPLEAARQLRGHAVEEAEASLARAVAGLSEAERQLTAARADMSAHAARARRDEADIAKREESGGSAAELNRGQAFRERLAREQESLTESVRDAGAIYASREAEVAAARAKLAELRAEKEVVERHHDRFRSAEAKEREAREEAEAEDLAAARRHRSSD